MYEGEEVDVGAFAVYSPQVRVIQVQLDNGDVLSIQDRGAFTDDQLRSGLTSLAATAVWNAQGGGLALPDLIDIAPSQ